jgi:hypothetical protein
MQQSDRARDVLREDRVHQRTGEARLSSGHEARSRAGRAFEQETSRPSVREWFEDPDEEIHGVEATEPVSIVETMRVGWLVRISDADGPTSSSSRPTSPNATGRSTGCA